MSIKMYTDSEISITDNSTEIEKRLAALEQKTSGADFFIDYEFFKNKSVKKRDGSIVDFDPMKIIKVIDKARLSVGVPIDGSDPNIGKYNAMITDLFGTIKIVMQTSEKDTICLERIQDMVETELWQKYSPKVGKEFTTYRDKREKERNGNILFKYKNRVTTNKLENSNANVDEASFSGKEKEASSDVSKYISLNTNVLSKEVAQAHKDMIVYQHDLEKAQFGMHNCLFPDFEKTLKGFTTRNGGVREAGSFHTATQQIAVIIQCQSQVQFGGAGAQHLDYDLAPYVKKSFAKHLSNNIERIYNRNGSIFKRHRYHKNMELINKLQSQITFKHGVGIESDIALSIKNTFPAAYAEAMLDLEEEGIQSCEAMYHNLNTLESRPGSQVPFSSINLGKDTTPEGRLINKWIFKASLNGVGEHHRTSIFPISIFSYKKGINSDPGDPNYDLKKLALESLSKRIYPNFANCDWSQAHEDPNDRDTDFATMG